VIVAAVMGTATGIVVPRLHQRRGSSLSAGLVRDGGISIGWSIRF
jgi:hypothetical protein